MEQLPPPSPANHPPMDNPSEFGDPPEPGGGGGSLSERRTLWRRGTPAAPACRHDSQGHAELGQNFQAPHWSVQAESGRRRRGEVWEAVARSDAGILLISEMV